MRIIHSVEEFQLLRSSFKDASIGFVPTMGNLHAGHESLIKRSVLDNDITILSIYVNPTQFNDVKDFNKYPKTLEQDLEIAKSVGVNYVFCPKYEEIYPDKYAFQISENTELSQILEGKCRPGHFVGVLTIVMKLLLIVRANRAYFGEKDYQQYLLVKNMAQAFFVNTAIIPCVTIRNKDGLALSSRNTTLSEPELQKAAIFPKLLSSFKLSDNDVKLMLQREGFAVEYIETYKNRRFGAIVFCNIRLIDNF